MAIPCIQEVNQNVVILNGKAPFSSAFVNKRHLKLRLSEIKIFKENIGRQAPYHTN